MTKTILLFPGQGSQQVGMGKSAAEVPEAAGLLRQASDILGMDMKQLIWEGPETELKKTENTQPALFLVSMMAMECLKLEGVSFDFTAGHSLGEYSALCAAGAYSFEDGLALVRLRGELMAKAGSERPGAMTAVIGMGADELGEAVKEAAAAGVVVVANYNSPSQIVISGEEAAVRKAEELARDAGAKKVVRLPVSGAFHSPLMGFALPGLEKGLEDTTFADPAVPVITNVDAGPCTQAGELKASLLRQLTSPVKWVDSMRKAVELGCGTGLEVGSGRVLMGLVRGISRELKVLPVESPEDVKKVKEAV
ncbi:ACP S-malonyltransferase [Fibrobacterota bacterium]